MRQFNVPTREEVSADNQAIFDKLKKGVGFVPNLYATLGLSHKNKIVKFEPQNIEFEPAFVGSLCLYTTCDIAKNRFKNRSYELLRLFLCDKNENLKFSYIKH